MICHHEHTSQITIMTVQLALLIITLTGIVTSSNIRFLSGELDSAVSLQCQIAQLPSNAVITWVYRPKIPTKNGVKWLPLYANARRLTQNNQRYIVDYSGFDIQTKQHLSILTINQFNISDEGIYMCKSNQHQALANIFNLTVIPSMQVHPHDGLIEFNSYQHSINLSCTVRELPTKKIDPLRLKWYHNDHEINHQRNSHLIHKYPHHNQATLILYIHHLAKNDSGLFKCIYDHGLISKDVQIIYTSSVLEYSKSMSRKKTCSCLPLVFLIIISLILR